jgi:hypothetical protein
MSEAVLEKFVAQLEASHFYEAHESLESYWFPRRFEDDDEIRLLKGFINAAVSFELLKRGRTEPSLRVWNNYLKYRPILDTLQSEMLGAYRRAAGKIEGMRIILSS